jgi:hypothetical protein
MNNFICIHCVSLPETSHKQSTFNFCLLNARSIYNKARIIQNFVTDSDSDIPVRISHSRSNSDIPLRYRNTENLIEIQRQTSSLPHRCISCAVLNFAC